MREEEYKEEILRTYMGSENQLDKLCLGALGLTGESGEVADIIKKILFHKHPIDAEKLREELGDVLWYLLLICDALGYTLEDIMTYNVQKLNKRYPNASDTNRS